MPKQIYTEGGTERMFAISTLVYTVLVHVEGGVNVFFPPGLLNTDLASARRRTQKVCKTFSVQARARREEAATDVPSHAAKKPCAIPIFLLFTTR